MERFCANSPISSSVELSFKSSRFSYPYSSSPIALNIQYEDLSDGLGIGTGYSSPYADSPSNHRNYKSSEPNRQPSLIAATAHVESDAKRHLVQAHHVSPHLQSTSINLHYLGIGTGHLTPLQSPSQAQYTNGSSPTSAISSSGGSRHKLPLKLETVPESLSPAARNGNELKEEIESIDSLDTDLGGCRSDDDHTAKPSRDDLVQRLVELARQLQSRSGYSHTLLQPECVEAISTKLDEVEHLILGQNCHLNACDSISEAKTSTSGAEKKIELTNELPASISPIRSRWSWLLGEPKPPPVTAPPSPPRTSHSCKAYSQNENKTESKFVKTKAINLNKNMKFLYKDQGTEVTPPNPLRETSLAKTCPEDADRLVEEAEKLCQELSNVVTSLKAKREE